jgi:hypothetical protein
VAAFLHKVESEANCPNRRRPLRRRTLLGAGNGFERQRQRACAAVGIGVASLSCSQGLTPGGALRFCSPDEYLGRTARDLRRARESTALSFRIVVDSNRMESRLTQGSTKCSNLRSARHSCIGYYYDEIGRERNSRWRTFTKQL